MNRHLPLIVPAAVGGVLIIATSVVQGIWTDRWTPTYSEELDAYANALRKVPKVLANGEWEMQDTTEMDPREREAAGAVGDLSRTYRNPHTQEVVNVYMICGPSRSVAIHTPDKCYTNSGFRMEDKIQRFTIPFAGTSSEFRTAMFIKEDTTSSQPLRVFWAWNSDGTWEAPEYPRMKYGGRTPLNKIYLITRGSPTESVDDSPAKDFAQEFLPVVTALLYPEKAADMKAAPSASKTDRAKPGKKPSEESPGAAEKQPAAAAKDPEG